MACPHFDLKIVGRAQQSRSVVASAAYQSGEQLYCKFQEKTKRYPKRVERIRYAEIMLPENAPKEYMDRGKLWNSVEMNEHQCNAQYARRFVMALPRELSEEENLAFARQYCREQFVSKGMCVDMAYHYDGDENPHIHVLTTMRAIDEKGRWMGKARKEYILDENGQRIRLPSGEWKSRKVRTTDWDDQGNLEKWRHAWEVLQNEYLEKAGRTERIDMRSYERQGVDLIPTIHMGPEATAMEKRGIRTYVGDMNREIKARNALLRAIKKKLDSIKEWLEERHQRKAEAEAERNVPTLRYVLISYALQRDKQRANWRSSYKLKYFAKDVARMQDIVRDLESKGMYNLHDFTRVLADLEGRYSQAKQVVKANEYRRKDIEKIEQAAVTYKRTKPIFDQCSRIFISRNKEKFAAANEKDLKDNKQAYARLMKYHGGKLEVQPDEFKAELNRMDREDSVAQAELESIKEELDLLHKARYYICKVDPELIGEKRSLREQLAETQEQIRQKDAERKNIQREQRQ